MRLAPLILCLLLLAPTRAEARKPTAQEVEYFQVIDAVSKAQEALLKAFQASGIPALLWLANASPFLLASGARAPAKIG